MDLLRPFRPFFLCFSVLCYNILLDVVFSTDCLNVGSGPDQSPQFFDPPPGEFCDHADAPFLHNGISELYSLDEFSPRTREDIGKAYMLGRYGSVPFLGEGDGLWD